MLANVMAEFMPQDDLSDDDPTRLDIGPVAPHRVMNNVTLALIDDRDGILDPCCSAYLNLRNVPIGKHLLQHASVGRQPRYPHVTQRRIESDARPRPLDMKGVRVLADAQVCAAPPEDSCLPT